MPDEEIEMHNKNHSHFQHYSCDPPSASQQKPWLEKSKELK